jgi:hypothetical protein
MLVFSFQMSSIFLGRNGISFNRVDARGNAEHDMISLGRFYIYMQNIKIAN